MEQTKRLSKVTLLAYGLGDFASNLCWTFIGSYLSVFYTDVVGMAPAAASAIMLIAKIWDGVNDPMFGAIAERTNTKKGRFRPYIFYGAPVLAVTSVLAFTTFGSGAGAIIWAAVSYIACGMAYTMVNLSYGSLSTVMTVNPEDINQLNSWRMMGTNICAVLLNAITAPLLAMLSGGETITASAYTTMAMVPDAINYEEDRSGVRADGTSYATVSLSTKFGSAFGVSGALLIMGATGYVANAQQTPGALNGINLTVNLLFGILYLLCLLPLYFYPLNEKRSEEIIARLEEKRAANQQSSTGNT